MRRKRRKQRTLRPRARRVDWTAVARRAGGRYAADHPIPPGAEPLSHINRLWCGYYHSPEGKGTPDAVYDACAKAFLESYASAAGIVCPDWVLTPTAKSVAAIVTVMNEEEAVWSVLEQLHRLPIAEIIVVVNGSADETFQHARRSSKAVIIHYHQPLGHDVGRAVGTKIAQSDILLFLDGDFPVAAEKLVPFIREIDRGADVALNDINPYIGWFSDRDGVTIVKEFLNRVVGRRDLGANSMTAVPHALSRRAVEAIGFEHLAVPPKAQALAVSRGLQVRTAASVDVFRMNKHRSINTGIESPVAALIIGDHMEALQAIQEEKGTTRLVFADSIRSRRRFREAGV